jgi:aldehyde:ferredoxin oxidoreductase
MFYSFNSTSRTKEGFSMRIETVSVDKFMKLVNNVQFQNEDIREAVGYGFKDVPEAFIKAEHAWARYWVVYDIDKVITLILEARDGNLTYFTTTDLPTSNIVTYIKLMKNLVNDVTKCREVVFVRTARWYKKAISLNKVIGFKEMIITNNYSIWVYEYGKQK